MSNFIYEIINQRVNFLKEFYETNKNVSHPGVKGTLNEVLLQEQIQELIPIKYKLIKGLVQDSKGEQSNESDIIIYNPEILPSFLFGKSLGVVPSESVNYLFEIKSILNAKEIKTTIQKFKNIKKLKGYNGRNILFAFSSDQSGSELKRYAKYEENFYKEPNIIALVVSNKGYYFFYHDKQLVKKSISKKDVTEQVMKKNFPNIKIPMESIDEKKLTINNIDYDELYYNRYFWHGVRAENNCEILSFLSGVSNTLSEKPFGGYLLNNCQNMKTYSFCIVDMWGNEVYKKIDFNGFDLENIKLSMTVHLSEDSNTNKIIINEKN